MGYSFIWPYLFNWHLRVGIWCLKYQKLSKTLIRSRFHGMHWCAHKTATLTSIQHTVPPPSYASAEMPPDEQDLLFLNKYHTPIALIIKQRFNFHFIFAEGFIHQRLQFTFFKNMIKSVKSLLVRFVF